MAVFFFIVTLEIKREFINGELSKPKQALLPIIAAVGGMAVPAIIYIIINFETGYTLERLGNSFSNRYSFFNWSFITARFKNSDIIKSFFNSTCNHR